MRFHESFQVAASPSAVLTMLATPAFCQLRAHTADAVAAHGSVDYTGPASFTVTLERTFPATIVPAGFRMFVPASLEVIQREEWDAFSAQLTVTVRSVPVSATGQVQLTGTPTASQLAISGELTAAVPFVGPTIEQQVVAMIAGFMAHEAQAAATWLAR